jgi:peroxiredoxin Q/BCP
MSIRSRAARCVAVLAVAAIAPSIVGAQAAPAAALTPLKVGEMAPDFTVTVVTAAGVAAKPFKLSEHKGETVVLAFFPKARTRGCTVQMESYRDQYAKTFQGGKKVTLVGVSIDSDTALISWATDAKFPFHFAADTDRKVGVAYGANGGTGYHKRTLYVIDPTGKISYVTASFNQMSADAYTELGNAIVHAGSSH